MSDSQPASRNSQLSLIATRLCAALFTGGEIEHARAHRITSPFVVSSHVHDTLLQFDWIVNCRGSVSIDGVSTRLDGGCALLVVSPRRPHAMSLEAGGEDARVYHTRIALPMASRRGLREASRVAHRLPASAGIEAALNDVWRLTVGAGGQSLFRQARLAEAIALWPGIEDGPAAGDAKGTPAGLDRDLDAPLQLMERSLLAPPTLDDLADAAHLSVRHFTRRFRAAFGIAPMAYLDRKRLALAQQMLAYESSGVGEVAERMGFSSVAVFSRWFGHLAGETPSDYRSRPHTL